MPDEAAEICAVVRQSIEQLCLADHDANPAILDRWLASKTPDRVKGWIDSNPLGVIAAVDPGGIAGVGTVLLDGRIAVNYVAPWARFRGISKALMAAMESRAIQLGHTACTLTSTVTAHEFYRRYGYVDDGEPVSSFGGKPAFPMRRNLEQCHRQ